MAYKEDKHSLWDILEAEEKYSATLWSGSATGSCFATEHLDDNRKNRREADADVPRGQPPLPKASED